MSEIDPFFQYLLDEERRVTRTSFVDSPDASVRRPVSRRVADEVLASRGIDAAIATLQAINERPHPKVLEQVQDRLAQL